MAVNDELGKRMKTFYEGISQTKLLRRTPVVIRIDGKAFHTFTKGFARPYDQVLRNAMNNTMKYLCKHIQGCVFGYCQSDEITLILVDYKHLNSDAWFDYEVQKLCSISASMATMVFNKELDEVADIIFSERIGYGDDYQTAADEAIFYKEKAGQAMFDARCFNIPREEVTNLIYWRQLDATRNSIQLAGQSYFSHNQLQNKSCNQIQEMLFIEKGVNWNDYDTVFKRGAGCVKGENGWEIDLEIPVFKGEDREYIERLIQPEEE